MEINQKHKEQFLRDVEALGFEEGLLSGFYDVLADGKQHRVTWQEYNDFGDTRVLYEPQLRLDDSGLPYLHGYTATLLETHPIHHGIYEQIDTRLLEEQLREGNWLSDKVLFSQLYAQITELSVCGNSIAKDIAQRLEARYWLGTTVDRYVNGIELRKKFGLSHFFACGTEPAKVTAIQAYNLMSGRPVLRFEQRSKNVYTGYWFGLKRLRNPVIREKDLFWFEQKRYDNFNAGDLLRQLPVKDLDQENTGILIVRRLMEGQIVPAILQISGTAKRCHVTADAENNRLRVLDEHGQEIFVAKSNLRNTKAVRPPPIKKGKGKRL